jgi:hypothetical protein
VIFHFPNLTRPKKAAKVFARDFDVSLATAQRGLARACGFRDWHDLETRVDKVQPFALDQELSAEEFVARQSRLAIALARELGVADGDTQHALAISRLTGDRPASINEQLAIRVACWLDSALPPVGLRQRGAVGKLKSPGRMGEPVILLRFGRPCEVVTHYSIAIVADHEYMSPRAAPRLFVPMRLYLPYGYWTEGDGARVAFSRDYNPLWRLRPDSRPERVKPWERISWKSQEHLWDDSYTPWNSTELYAQLLTELRAHKVETLPVLVDALPLLVAESTGSSLAFSDAADLLHARRTKFLKPKTF